METSSGEYYWVAGQRPPFTFPGSGDRQAWIRTDPFDPDWRRVSDVINNSNGTGAPAFNTSFRLSGHSLPLTVAQVDRAVAEVARFVGAVLQAP